VRSAERGSSRCYDVLEIPILLVMPCMVSLMVAVHAWASAELKVFGVLAVVFVSLVAVVTCGIHFVLLTVGRQSAFTGQSWAPALLSFTWPSVAYALDVLAWDGFFAVAAISAAMAFGIVGYAGVFPVAALLLALLFRRTPPHVA
jgi:hypothetical protein